MVILLTILHVIVCFILIGVVLLQSGKAADLAGAFGGMGSQTAFGPRGSATLLSKVTTIAAGVFMVTSLTLSVLATRGGGVKGGSTVLEKNVQTAPAVPATKGGQPAPRPVPGAGVQVQTTGGAADVVPIAPAPVPAKGQPVPAPAKK